ncbi:hypothetical protein A2966_03545 [Candidatus Roizmanbacteria bacterium RIFCSPLOWO2_01_FULL_41_22]|uniref:Uncharacterized protein n=1 Tax=Candidatus Roizmanbacteria bacterium RIFCSPLOWO2_01_FULL_41_22 TaxID=1802067 RepID=A0A1F7JAC3_9BACT|nr:MAG: hypothetical protein A2966_03545 [Candidatus Roizmanbacteria bacterium RIFCSPLOWO2_01_FULL_41_22]
MDKGIKHMVYAPHYCSYLPILIEVIQRSDGPVLEMGMGPFSTPVLHWLCIEMKRPLVSYDNNPEYFEENKAFENGGHQVKLVDSWDDADIENTLWGVAFLDHAPDYRRKEDAKRLANNVDYLILHDSEETKDKYFHYSEIYPLFRYRYNYKRRSPFTVVLSNNKYLLNLR